MSLSLATLRGRIQHANTVSQLAELYAEVVDLNPENACEEDLLLSVLDLINNRIVQLVEPHGLMIESRPVGESSSLMRPPRSGGD